MKSQNRQVQAFASCAIVPLIVVSSVEVTGDFGFLLDSSHPIFSLGSIFITVGLCGVLTRWAKSLLPKPSSSRTKLCANSVKRKVKVSRPKATIQGSDDRAKLVQRFLDQGRTAILLRPKIARTLEADHFSAVQTEFQKEYALIQAGEIVLADWTFEESDPPPHQMAKRCEQVNAFYLDRFIVTNHQFKEFVSDKGYDQQSLWDVAIWPRVSEFVDRSSTPGPRFWDAGGYGPGEDDWPVVGVSWYEADAFARWAGRRLPSDAEWVKAAACPTDSTNHDTVLKKFPWGDAFDPQRANLWISSWGGPNNVTDFQNVPSSHPIVQLIGNVWEWTACDVKITSYARDVQFERPLKSLRGGAFDTYFENQVTCHLQSGDSPLSRRRNVGFRCGLSATDVIDLGGTA